MLRTRNLSRVALVWSLKAGVVGDELTDMISEHRRKGTGEFAQLSTVFPYSFYQDDPHTRALLTDYLSVPGVASSDGLCLTPAIQYGLGFQIGEKLERGRKNSMLVFVQKLLYRACGAPRHEFEEGGGSSAEEKRGTASCCPPREEGDEDDASQIFFG
jgi:hypothetical protein